MCQRGLRVLALLALALCALALQVAPAGAVFHGRSPRAARSGSNSQLRLTGLGPGGSVSGFIADSTNPFDPVADGYPPSDPTTGFTPKDESFAGVIHAEPPGGGAEESLYCIDINTDTYIGFGYILGTWDAANVPNVGYVARLLDEYYPNTNEPAALTDLNRKAAAVQAAIWFFSDRYVLSECSPLHDAVVSIVNRIRSEGPLTEPPPPSLAITPTRLSGPAGRVLGPFTVTTGNRLARRLHRLRTAPDATVNATGASMFSDPAGTVPIADGSAVPSGQKLWLRSTGPSSAVLQATARAVVPSGNVYLYDGNSGVSDAQRLILSRTAELTTTVQATAEFLPPGSLVVRKRIAGSAAGSQGRVVIQVTCDDGADRPDFAIPAGAPAGVTARTYSGIPAGTACTVIETSNGSTVGTAVVVTGDGQDVTIGSGASETVNLTDTYRFVGSLLVRKTIAGPAAGQQGAVTIHTACNGTALAPDFVIAAGSPAGTQTKQYDQIPAPASCTVTETTDGHTGTVSVVVEGSGRPVSVATGEIAEADITDTYGLLPGQLQVTKTIAGPLAGQQGTIVIHTVCNGTALTPDLIILGGAPAGDEAHIYSNVPTPASCVVTESADGHSDAVPLLVTGSPQTVTIAPGGSGAAHIIDTYGPAPGSLLITKTIAGRIAGRQGPVIIHTVCNGSPLSPDFVIGARTPAGSVSHSFSGIPAGSICTVTETADGATATVTATASGSSQTVTVPAGSATAVNLIDVYRRPPGLVRSVFQRARDYLKVTKTIAGSGARRHGPIAILVACGGPLQTFAFRIAAHTAGSVSRIFAGLRPRSRCAVTETTNGRTGTVTVRANGSRREVTIRTNRMVTVHLTDTFSPKPKPRPAPSPPTGLGLG